MLFLYRPVLYRAGTEQHGNAKTTLTRVRCFAARAGAQTVKAHCFVRFASFAAFKKRIQYNARWANSHSARPNGRDVRTVGLSQNLKRYAQVPPSPIANLQLWRMQARIWSRTRCTALA